MRQPGSLTARTRHDGTPLALVIDDDPGIRALIRDILEPVGWRVQEAGDGREGCSLCCSLPVSAAIVDLVMPEQEGIETIQILRRQFPSLRIVAVSGAFGGLFLRVASRLGANAALHKPFGAEELINAVTGA